MGDGEGGESIAVSGICGREHLGVFESFCLAPGEGGGLILDCGIGWDRMRGLGNVMPCSKWPNISHHTSERASEFSVEGKSFFFF